MEKLRHSQVRHPLRAGTGRLLVKPVALGISLVLCLPAVAGEYYFPHSLIDGAESVADLSQFESGGQVPGSYQVDVSLNNEPVDTSVSLTFRKRDGKENGGRGDSTGLEPCLSAEYLRKLNVNVDAFPAFKQADNDSCAALSARIPGATATFDFQNMTLDLSVPQAAMVAHARGEVPPERWDEGVNAALFDYRFSGDQSKYQSGRADSQYFSLNSGLNIGPWRLRDNSVYTRYASRTTSHSRWEHIKTYAERTIVPWKSELTAGDAATSGDVFDSVGFRGIQLASDDSMYPDSARGYAPVIRGIAQSNAQVSIAQNGYTVYQTYVSAGPFEIRDLYSMASAGDLTVRIKESDGRIREFTVPYSAVPVLQRAGHYRYAVTAGQFRSGSSTERKPGFVEGTLIKGFDHDITVYGGTQLGQRYRALSLGAGLNMGDWGAISADITQANSQLADDSHHQGQSLRFLYAHAFNATGTTFQLTGYRYSTKGFYTLEESARRRMSGWADDEFDEYGRPVKHDNSAFYNLHNNRRERVVANISQSVPGFGSVYLSGTRQTYWNTGQVSTVWQTGLSSSAFGATYNLSYSYSHEPGFSRPDRVLAFMVSVPLDRVFGTHHQLYATASMNRDNNGNTAVQAGLSGTALEGNNLNWSVSQGRSETENGDSGASGNAQLSYFGGYGDAGLGYSYSRHERELNYALSGGAVITRDGLTLSQPLGDTNVLIAAPGAANVRVENETGIHTDFRGYTVVPYASIYRENRISLDTGSLDDHTDMDDNVDTVVPTRGALVKARFNTHAGFRAIVTLTRQGKPLPFGTLVTHDSDTGIIGDDGQVYLSGLAMKGRLDVKWGGSAGESCSAPWAIPQSQMKAPLVVMTLPCN